MRPAANRRILPCPHTRTCSSPPISTSSSSRSAFSSSSRAETLKAGTLLREVPPWLVPRVRSARARTARSSRCCSRWSRSVGSARLCARESLLLTSRNAARSACNCSSAGGRTRGTASVTARHRSLQASINEGLPSRRACRWPRFASSAPCAVLCARSSEDPSMSRYPSIRSSPRRQARIRRRGSPAACARSASASHAVARGRAGPRRRPAATAIR